MPVKGKAENKMLQKKKKNQGFTLVELIVVIVIILILAAVAVPSITRYVQKSKIAKCANQRHELATQFQIMGTDVPELALCTLEGEVENILKKDVLNYMVENGYCSRDITVCPVYNEKYELEISVENGQQHVEFVCQCVDSIKGYVFLCSKYYDEIVNNGNKWPGREKVIEMVMEKKGGFQKVSSSIKNKTAFASVKDDFYWKPYYLTKDKMMLFATPDNTSSNSGWKAELLYIDGEVYQSTVIENGKPKSAGIADIYRVYDSASKNDPKYSSLENYLREAGFEKVS